MKTAEARSRDRVKFLENTLTRRKEQEIKHNNEVLEEKERIILRIFEEEEQPRQQKFNFDEERQFKRDLDALGAQLKQIPGWKKNN